MVTKLPRHLRAALILLAAGFAEIALGSCGDQEILFPAPVAQAGQPGDGGAGGADVDAGPDGDAGDQNVKVVTCPDGGGLLTATFPGRPLSELARVVVLDTYKPNFPPYNAPGTDYKSYQVRAGGVYILDAEAGVLLFGICTASDSGESILVVLPPRGH